MKINTLLDCDLVALESADELTLMVELTAPTRDVDVTRAPATLQVVLDRSGSMAGERLEGAKNALSALVDRLDPTDNFGLVAFDDGTMVVVPAGPLTDKAAVKKAITALDAGGSTDLSGGYLRGLQEVRRVAGPGGATLLLVSDGHANRGVVDPVALGKVATDAQLHRITTSTLGFGLGYDELLLSALAQGGAGNELFAEEADAAVGIISGEVDGLLDQVAQAASLRVRWTPHVAGAHVLNDLPTAPLPDGFVCELGSFYAGEERKLLIRLSIPGIAALGLTQVATLELVHVSLPDLIQHTTTLPVHVNVVPGDQAAGRVPHPVVRSEALFQQSQAAKRQASQLLSQGKVGQASRLLRETSASFAGIEGLPDELVREASMLQEMAEEADVDSYRAAKITSTSGTLSSRQRGRRSRGGQVRLRWAYGHEDVAVSTLMLEEWEVVRLNRLLDPALSRVFRPDPDKVQGEDVATAVADALGAEHPHHTFFATAAFHGGFTVERT